MHDGPLVRHAPRARTQIDEVLIKLWLGMAKTKVGPCDHYSAKHGYWEAHRPFLLVISNTLINANNWAPRANEAPAIKWTTLSMGFTTNPFASPYFLSMTQDKRIIFYTSPYSPYANRVQIALEETKLKVTKYDVDLRPGCKPDWFTRVNPAGTVPAFTVGGPAVPPDQPSSESAKVWESLVLIEFIADLCPEAGLVPRHPELRAKARLFITLSHETLHHAFRGFFFRGERIDSILPSLEAFQTLLAPTGYAVGPWSIADIAVAPMMVRFMRLSRYEIGKYPMDEGRKLLKALAEPKFARLVQYYEMLWARPSIQAAWDEPLNVKMWRIHPNVTRSSSAAGH